MLKKKLVNDIKSGIAGVIAGLLLILLISKYTSPKNHRLAYLKQKFVPILREQGYGTDKTSHHVVDRFGGQMVNHVSIPVYAKETESPSPMATSVPLNSPLPSGTPVVTGMPSLSPLPSGTPVVTGMPSLSPLPSGTPVVTGMPSLSPLPSGKPSIAPSRGAYPSITPLPSVDVMDSVTCEKAEQKYRSNECKNERYRISLNSYIQNNPVLKKRYESTPTPTIAITE